MSEPLSAERLAEIRARTEAATEGPWEAKSCGDTCCLWIEGHDGEMLPRTDAYSDVTFIAHARQDVPDLLAEVDRLRARNVIGSRAWLAVEVSRLKEEVDRLAAENARLSAPGCGGPDCRMIGLHTVNTCPTYQERVPVYEKTWPASGPSRWFSAADDRHGTDPAWDGESDHV